MYKDVGKVVFLGLLISVYYYIILKLKEVKKRGKRRKL
jgi:hypothetical protein